MIRRAVYIAAGASLAAAIGFSVFSLTRAVDAAACERYEQELRSLLALDFRLTAEVMKARSGLIGHYDGIVQTVVARRRSLRALRELPQGLPERGRSELEARLLASERARGESERQVERFEREHAVLRNSLRFLPVLAAELERTAADSLAREEQESRAAQATAPPARQNESFSIGSSPLLATVTGLVRDALLLQSWPEAALLARIDRALERLGEAGAHAPESYRRLLETLVDHARIVRERTPAVQALTRQIAAAADARHTQASMTAFLTQRRAAMQVADRDASVRFALALVALAAIAASIIVRLRHAAVSLQRSSDQLGAALGSLRVEQAKQKELSELKNRFVSMASHEFRTPLSVIMSSSELLEAYGERWAESKKQEHFTRIRQAALGMTRMLEAVLMIGRRDAGLLTFQPQPLEIGRFCGQVLDQVGAASGQAARMVYRGPSVEQQVLADPTLLRHVLENLLSNALKYSPNGTDVELSVARERGELWFQVCDRGIGISQDDQRHLFESFHRGKNVGEISGSGLGLAIVKGAVELHGGSVSVESELSAGTQFTVRIPCAESGA